MGLAAGLVAVSPLAAGKMYKCTDGGAVVFQQSPCPETAKEAEAREKEKQRLKAEEARMKEEAARKKEEQARMARERDKAYQLQLEERKKAEEAEKRLLKGTEHAKAEADSGLPDNIEAAYPGPWKETTNVAINAALSKNKVAGCDKFQYRHRGDGGADYLVHCGTNPKGKVHYFVWPKHGGVRGPVRF